MPRRRGPSVLPVAPPSRILGVVGRRSSSRPRRCSCSRCATAAPVVSLGVVYLVAVLVISTVWGAWLGVLTALASALAFNYFHIPPTGRFTIADSENWVALVVFLIVAVIGSSVAQVARARARPRPSSAGARPTSPPRWRGCCCAATSCRSRCPPRRSGSRRRWACRRRRSSSRRSRATSGGSRSRCARGRPSSARCSCRRGCRRRRCGACRSAWCRASRRCWRPGSTATGCSARWSRRARCAAPTWSRRRCCARSRTTCARR